MIKREFVRQCAASTNLSQKQVSDVLDYIISTITTKLCKDESVKLFGLGKLKLKHYNGKPYYDFKTGALSSGEEYTKLKFEPGVYLKKILMI